MRSALVLLSLAVGLPRVLGVTSEPYQAAAHLWVGGLIGAGFALRAVARSGAPARPGWRRLLLTLWVGLTILEVVCFLVGAVR